jgi:hypothetical protein
LRVLHLGFCIYLYCGCQFVFHRVLNMWP